VGEDKLFKIKDFDNLSVAVDIQVARVTCYTDALKILGSYCGCIHHEPVRPMIEDTWNQAAKRIGVPAWYLDEPLWSIGSRLCSKRKWERCPIKEMCQKNLHYKFKGSNIWCAPER